MVNKFKVSNEVLYHSPMDDPLKTFNIKRDNPQKCWKNAVFTKVIEQATIVGFEIVSL